VDRAIVIPPGGGVRTGNVEFLGLSEHSPRLNVSVITMAPNADGPESHVHADEDDVFYVLDGELTFELDGGDVAAPTGTFVLVPPGVKHTFRNALDRPTRVLNIHAPAGFDRRLMASDWLPFRSWDSHHHPAGLPRGAAASGAPTSSCSRAARR
jgi:mannose-6-phosphate isomerase-like protein (cupin superfamily)